MKRPIALTLALAALATAPAAEPPQPNLVKNPQFTAAAADVRQPADFTLSGSASWAVAGRHDEFAPHGVALDAGKGREGSVAQDVTGFDATATGVRRAARHTALATNATRRKQYSSSAGW